MASDYTPDRWRDRSIIAQSSAKIAADLMAFGVPEGITFYDAYKNYHKLVFDSILELAGDESWQSLANPTQGQSSEQQTKPSSSSSTSGAPYASTKITFGKFKGMTIGEINNATGNDGKSGRSYLEWLHANTDQDFLKKAVGGFLEATK